VSKQHAPNRRNVIWVFGDQHRAQATGYMGDGNLSTPNLDRMASDGVFYRQAVSGFPLCCPYRGSLVTSRYPHQCVPGHEHRLPPEQPTVAHAFREAGYETAYFGKWHLDGFQERDGRAAMHIVPPERRGGFDRWMGYDNNNAQWDCWVHGCREGEEVHYRLPGYETDCLTDMLIDYIRGRAGEGQKDAQADPFFAVLSVQPPHNPYVAPEEWMVRQTPGRVELRPNVPPVRRIQEQARRELAGYYAQIENLDWNVGRIRRALAETGLEHDTYVVFFSDHGDMHGCHGQFKKMTAFEESIRVPMIISRGGDTLYEHRRGPDDRALINHVDLAPTSLGLAGLTPPDWMEGTDYSGTFQSGGPRVDFPDSAYLQSVIPTGHGDSTDRPWRGVVTADGWKYVCLEHQPWMLFNLNEDPYELANMALNTLYASERKRLHERLRQWMSDTRDEFALPRL